MRIRVRTNNGYVTNAKNPKSSMILGIIFFLFFALIGVVLLFGNNAKKKRCTEPSQATIIENKTITSRRRTNGRMRENITYAPVYQYEYEGIKYTVTSSSSANPPAFSVGDVTKIYINPGEPAEFYVPADRTVSLVGIIFIGIGCLGAVIMLIALLKMRGTGKSEINFI